MEILSYSFFQNALIAWFFIAISASLLWNFIVVRREVQIGHTIANASFLWIILGLIFSVESVISWIILALIAWVSIFFLEKSKKITSDSVMEFVSQMSMASWIFLLSFLSWLKIDILSFLFGNILAVNTTDLYISWSLMIIISIFIYKYWKDLLGHAVSFDISQAIWKKTNILNISFLLICSLLIAVSIKIFWILLIWAFLVLPANIWKLIWKSFLQMRIISVLSAILAVISWLFISYYFDASPWASIVLILWIWVIFSVLYSKIKEN
jgi:zinc transport system permease protein